jgi:hypothetical protein
MKDITKAKQENIRYFNFRDMCEGLEPERPGIRQRLKDHLVDYDFQFQMIKDRILHINLFYYGVGDEYPIKDKYVEKEIEHSKIIHPKAFKEGTLESEIRKDLNLIWSVYEVDNEEVEIFHVFGW